MTAPVWTWPADHADFVVRRSRLVRRLDAAVNAKLALVVAPAGFGKSILVREWAGAYRRAPVISLSLDRTDADGDHFTALLVNALNDLERWAGGMRQTLTSMPHAVVLLDGLETLGEGDVLDRLHALVVEADHLHFVLATRTQPAPLAQRFRARSQLGELRAGDLAFNRDEARALVEGVSGRPMTDDQIDELLARTDGWPAGIHMAAMSLRAHPDP